MKKILTNKKGFTLIELLAVIVVLAIIMVIATQQVNSTIKKSRANTYADTVMSIKKGLQTICATNATITTDEIKETLDFSDVTLKGTSGVSRIVVTPTASGKYSNMDMKVLATDLKNKKDIDISVDDNSKTARNEIATITTDCNLGEDISIEK